MDSSASAAAQRITEAPPGQLIDRVIANVSGRIVLYSELAGAAEQARQGGETVTPALICAELERVARWVAAELRPDLSPAEIDALVAEALEAPRG